MGIAKSTGTIKSFDGTEIYYETHGSGEPIVFIYGLACLMNHWHFQVDYFSQKYQVITFDISGHHKSVTKDFNNINLESVAKDIDILIKDTCGPFDATVNGDDEGIKVLYKQAKEWIKDYENH